MIKGYELDYSEILSIKNKNGFEIFKEIKGKYDNMTNSGTIELSNELFTRKYKETNKYIEDKYFMIKIEIINSFDFKNLEYEIYVFPKDKNFILLPINKYIRYSFNLLENKNIFQKYFFEKEKIKNKEFILEFSSNYDNIELIFNDLTNYNILKIIGGFKKYILSIDSDNSNDFFFNVVIKPIYELNEGKYLEEVNIIIKYYNNESTIINTDYICNKTFKLESKNNRENNSDYNLIIKNQSISNNFYNSSDILNFIYYLRLIKKKEILNNEQLNTIAPISSELLYVNKYSIADPNQEFSFNLTNLENNESYIASFFIKVENKSKGEETYYSMNYEYSTELKIEKNNSINNNSDSNFINMILIIIIIFILLISFIIWRKLKIKNANLENKVKAIEFSSGLNGDYIINKELIENRSDSYENTFI